MQENTILFRTALSLWGAVTIGLFGALVGTIWAAVLGVDLLVGAAVVAAVGAVWGGVIFQLTPTGGIVMENKTTVNYAVIALHGWYTAFAVLIAAVILLIQQFV